LSVKFYLGTHVVNWLWSDKFAEVPLFVSRTTLSQRKTLKPAVCDWALDSGAFTELSIHGRWTVAARDYADFCLRCRDGVGRMDFCTIQDWMCEDAVILGGRVGLKTAPGTGLTLREHQRRTVESYFTLRSLEPSLPWLPVLQGYSEDDYLHCFDLYQSAGADLVGRWVGVGSVCKRQGSDEIARVLRTLSSLGLRLHGFGVKTAGLEKAADYLHSADSMAWSFGARMSKIKTAECVAAGETHRNCANCWRYARQWREQLIQPILNRQRETSPCFHSDSDPSTGPASVATAPICGFGCGGG
jgi:hypothetical protein